MMNEKSRSIVIVVLLDIVLFIAGAAVGWFGHRAYSQPKPVDTDTSIMQSRAEELEQREPVIDEKLGRGIELLDRGAGAVRDGQGNVLRINDSVERIGEGLDDTIRGIEGFIGSGDSPPTVSD
jgi:hypothetical protein